MCGPKHEPRLVNGRRARCKRTRGRCLHTVFCAISRRHSRRRRRSQAKASRTGWLRPFRRLCVIETGDTSAKTHRAHWGRSAGGSVFLAPMSPVWTSDSHESENVVMLMFTPMRPSIPARISRSIASQRSDEVFSAGGTYFLLMLAKP
jgi:hypothetical protein